MSEENKSDREEHVSVPEIALTKASTDSIKVSDYSDTASVKTDNSQNTSTQSNKHLSIRLTRSVFRRLSAATTSKESHHSSSPPSSSQMAISATPTRLSQVLIGLVPHQHTSFCERKERVCTAIGKIQELESLRVQGLDGDALKPLNSVWLRSKADYIHDEDKSLEIDFATMFSPIAGSENNLIYQMTAEDLNRYIGYVFMIHDQCYASPSIVGPVLPAPPRILDFQIEGTLLVGNTVRAVGKYIGGIEGKTEYWWMRIRDGVRETLSTNEACASTEANDPKEYLLSNDDVGCVLKVKCRPVRDDGVKGEIFTSKATDIIVKPD